MNRLKVKMKQFDKFGDYELVETYVQVFQNYISYSFNFSFTRELTVNNLYVLTGHK